MYAAGFSDVYGIYAEAVPAGNLAFWDSVIDPDETSSVTASSNASFWFELSGMLVRQEFSCIVEYQFSGAVFTVTVTDTGTVLAVSDTVTVVPVHNPLIAENWRPASASSYFFRI